MPRLRADLEHEVLFRLPQGDFGCGALCFRLLDGDQFPCS